MTNEEIEGKRHRWREIVARWRAGGDTKAAFCRENGLKEWQFHYWFARLRELDAPAGFAAVDCPAEGVRLRLLNGLTVELDAGFDENVLARFLAVATRAC